MTPAISKGGRLSTLLLGSVLLLLLGVIQPVQASGVDDELAMIASARHTTVDALIGDSSVYTQSTRLLSEAEARAEFGDDEIPPSPGVNATWRGVAIQRKVNPDAIAESDPRRQVGDFPRRWSTDTFLWHWDDIEQEDREHYCGVLACGQANSGYGEGLSYETKFSIGLEASLESVIVASLGIEWSVSTSENFYAMVRGGGYDSDQCCKRLWTSKNIQLHIGTLYKDHWMQMYIGGRPNGEPVKMSTDTTYNVEVRSGGLDGDGWLGYTSGATACWDEDAGCGDQSDFCFGTC